MCLSLFQPGKGDNLWEISQGQVIFESDAPLELIKAHSDEVRGIIDLTDNNFAFTIPISSFHGFNSALQEEHFNENYLESDRFPRATFTGKVIENLNHLSDHPMKVRAKGTMTIHGIQRERIISSEISMQGDKLILDTSFLVELNDHDIKIPRVVNQKIAEHIQVHLHAVLIRKPQ
jgi:polyisoprenoid-binding protein YceI